MDVVDLVDSPAERGRIDAVEMVNGFLDRISARTDSTHAIVAICAERALADAALVDSARRLGRPLPLDGLPIVIKDNIDVAGELMTCGSKFFVDRRATHDAFVVGLLREAGAVVLGISQAAEMMFALAPHPMFEPCRNPWDPARIPGASSGGSASAIADDQAIGALGTDTGGSIRTPSAYCGVTGFRPTFGLVSNTGVFPVARSFDTVGPIARSAVDVGNLFHVIAQFDSQDDRAIQFEPWRAWSSRSQSTLRIGVPRQFFFDKCDPQVLRVFQAALATFEDLGHILTDVDVPLAYAAHDGFSLLVRAEALSIHKERLAERPDDFSPNVRDRLRLAQLLTGSDFASVMDDMYAWRRQLGLVFEEQVDVMVSPTSQVLPPLIEEASLGKLPDVSRLVYPWSFGNLPAISIPCGFEASGLPVGLQIAGAPHSDWRLIDLARQYQAVTDWHRRRPAGR